jgi:hypothetical protein
LPRQLLDVDDNYIPDWLINFSPRRTGVLVNTCSEPLDYFMELFPNDAFELMSQETNRYALQFFDQPAEVAENS